MNDNALPCTRRRYIATLHRYVGPLLGWRVVNAHNSNRASSPREGVATPLSGDPHQFTGDV